MKEGWEYKTLGEVCNIYQPKTISKKDCAEDGKYLVYGANGIIGKYNEFNHENSEVLLGCRGSVGCITISAPYSWINGNAMVIHPKNCDLSQKFLAYQLKGVDLSKVISGIAQPQITRQALSPIVIGLPPLSEQQNVVEELDLLNSIIGKKKKQLKDLDTLAQSIFYEMFGDPIENEKGWEVKKLKDIVSKECSISYGIIQPGDGVENGVPVVRPVDMTHTFIKRSGLKHTTKEVSDSYKRTILKGNEILLCVRGTTGLVALATDDIKGCNVTRGVSPIECNADNNRLYIYHLLLTHGVQQHIANYTKGIALKQINMQDVREIPLIIPPLPLQQSFARKIEGIEHQKNLIKNSITEVEMLFNSRMNYFFN